MSTQSTSTPSFTAPDGAPLVDLSEWPKVSLQKATDILTAPGQKWEVETTEVHGRPTKVWKNAPATFAHLARHARSHGRAMFTIYDTDRVSYESWFRAVSALGRHFLDLGIKKGDRIALSMRNLPEWPVVYFAATTIGAIIVPLNAWWTEDELAYGLENSGSKIFICDYQRYERIKDRIADLPALEKVYVSRVAGPMANGIKSFESLIGAPNDYYKLPDQDLPDVGELHPDDDATLFYTSGTTGKPKGAVGTHRSTLSNIITNSFANARTALRRGEEPAAPVARTSLMVIPLFHVTACNSHMMTNIFVGGTMCFMYKWDPIEAFQIIEREKVASTGGVPTIAWQILEHPERKNYDLSSLETISYGGAPAAPDLVFQLYKELGVLPGTGWGMTETCATVTSAMAEDYLKYPASCGAPVAVADIKIMARDGSKEMPTGELGEMWVRGPMVVREYWNRPEATAETFVDGWCKTGDLAKIDEEGWVTIGGRAKEMIIRGGENIYPQEVENVLYDHPAVTDAALIGLPHRTLGEEPAAVVHCAPGQKATEAELRAWVKERLAAFKVPVRIVFTEDVLPRNANGKIMKRDLGALFEDEARASA